MYDVDSNSPNKLTPGSTAQIWLFYLIENLHTVYSVVEHILFTDSFVIQERKNIYFFMQPANSINVDNRPERKLLIIPIIFLFLRIWDLVNDVIFLCHPDAKIRHHKWLLLLTVSCCIATLQYAVHIVE